MNENEIKQALNILSIVTGDCPYERGIGVEKDVRYEKSKCISRNCVDCWKIALSKELKRLNE